MRDRTESRRGNYAMLMGFLIPLLMGFAALAVDMSYMVLANTQAQYTADAAAHAAMVMYRATGSKAQGEAAAEAIRSRNRVGDATPEIAELTWGNWDGDTFVSSDVINAVHVRIARAGDSAIPLFFAPIIGQNEFDVVAPSTTTTQAADILVVQDVSGSFGDDIFLARDANLAFLDYMDEHGLRDDQIGMVLFKGAGITWTPLQPIGDNYDDIRARWEELTIPHGYSSWRDSADRDGNGLPDGLIDAWQVWQRWRARYSRQWWWDAYGYESEYQLHKSWVNSLNANDFRSMNWNDMVEQKAGLAIGPVDFDSAAPAATYNPTNWCTSQGRGFDEAIEQFVNNGDDSKFRAIIVVSDGVPFGCGSESAAERRAMALQAAQEAWEDHGIHIWSVAFMNGEGDFSFLQELTKGMGSAYETPDPAELEEILLEIASGMPLAVVE